jgi:hypothetical protein
VTVYLIQLALIVLMHHVLKRVKNGKYYFTIFAFIFLTIVAGFRGYNVGSDTVGYLQVYNNYINGIEPNMEKGFILLLKILSLISENPATFVIASSIIINGGVCYFVYKNSSNVFMSIWLYVTLYLYFFSFNATRQFIAIAIMLVAYTFAKEKKLLRFLLLWIVATSIHNICVLGIIIYPLYNIKMSRVKMILITTGSIGLVFVYENIIEILVRYFPRYTIHLDTLGSQNGGIMFAIIYGGVFVLAILLKPKFERCSWNNLFILMAVAAAGGILNLFVAGAMRAFYLFDMVIILVLPEIFHSTTRLSKQIKGLCYATVYVSTFSYMIYYFSYNWHYVLPYQFR